VLVYRAELPKYVLSRRYSQRGGGVATGIEEFETGATLPPLFAAQIAPIIVALSCHMCLNQSQSSLQLNLIATDVGIDRSGIRGSSCSHFVRRLVVC
jgi:hypothetical protein